jgi:hypothetical protein
MREAACRAQSDHSKLHCKVPLHRERKVTVSEPRLRYAVSRASGSHIRGRLGEDAVILKRINYKKFARA